MRPAKPTGQSGDGVVVGGHAPMHALQDARLFQIEQVAAQRFARHAGIRRGPLVRDTAQLRQEGA